MNATTLAKPCRALLIIRILRKAATSFLENLHSGHSVGEERVLTPMVRFDFVREVKFEKKYIVKQFLINFFSIVLITQDEKLIDLIKTCPPLKSISPLMELLFYGPKENLVERLFILRVVVEKVTDKSSEIVGILCHRIVLIGPTMSTHTQIQKRTNYCSFGDRSYRAVTRNGCYFVTGNVAEPKWLHRETKKQTEKSRKRIKVQNKRRGKKRKRDGGKENLIISNEAHR